ncbi:MAG: SEC-C metal-binding domain-containing protein [Armatimonadota bacterium]|nr:SEC-C metal-binding domain-containing protein [Armatimonadota bacterium]
MRNVGRNDPCPCGSGLKYKKCCLGREETSSPSGLHEEIFSDVREAMKGKQFASREEAQVFLNGFVQQRNSAPRDEFHGLSSDQMNGILYYPFDSPELVTFPSCLDTQPSAPILTLFQLLAEAIGDQGLKPTATGNLPRKFLREAGLAYWGEVGYQKHTQFGNIRTETDLYDMHVTRIVAELAGLVRKYKGKFILGRDCRKLLGERGMAGIYPRLLRTYAEEFNWGYRDGYPEIDFIQRSFLFTLYLFHRYGGDWRPSGFYEDAFLRAFPIVLKEVPPISYSTPEKEARNCYSWRCLKGFAEFLGLVEIEQESDDLFERRFKLKKLPLLNEAVLFHV